MIVAGGGIIGLSCAWRLARRGVRVTVFDARRLAEESSWAAAGMLAPGGEFAAPSPLAEMSLASLRLYPGFVLELERETGLPIDYQACGALDVAFNQAQYADLEQRATAQRAMGIPSEPAAYEGHTARLYPDDALVNPRDLTAALVEACRLAGVEFRQNEPILAIDDDGRKVHTSNGAYTCDGVLVAAGAWSSELHPRLRQSFPVRGHLIGWRSPDVSAGPILRNGHTYVVRRASGQFVAGSSTELAGFDRTVDPAIVRDLHSRVANLMPSAPQQDFTSWIGFRPGVQGEEPEIGMVEGTRIFTAYGHYRNGILLAPETARRIDLLIASS